MAEHNLMKAYITYPYNDDTRAVLMHERIRKVHKIIINDHEYQSRGMIPRVIINDLIARKKAEVVLVERVTYEGRDKIFNIPLSSTRVVKLDRDRYIQVRILANNLFDLMEGVSTVKRNMQIYDLQPKVCMWDKVGWIQKKDDEPEPEKLKVDFDEKQVKEQRELELYTARRELNNSITL